MRQNLEHFAPVDAVDAAHFKTPGTGELQTGFIPPLLAPVQGVLPPPPPRCLNCFPLTHA
eukprot:3534147-Pleurochrysis_carterae.AAC.1